MLRNILFSLSNKLPCRLIDHEGKPYLERHLLGTVFGTRVYLHRFVASDPAGVHDHPFERAFSFIVAGWYFEDRWGQRRKKQWFNTIGPNDFHRVVLPNNGKDVWTIFFHTPRVKPWGFLRVTSQVDNGSVLEYVPESSKEDPAFSDWSKDRCGREVRAAQSHPIAPGNNAYSQGLLAYPNEDIHFVRQNLKPSVESSI